VPGRRAPQSGSQPDGGPVDGLAEALASFPTGVTLVMVADGRDLIRVAPWVSFAPGIAIGLAVLDFNLVGDALREAYDPRLRDER